MSLRILMTSIVLALTVFGFVAAEEKNADPFAKGDALLREGDFKGAFDAYAEASKADPGNPAYAEKAMLVRRIAMLRGIVERGEVNEQWEKTVLALHSFYITHEVHGEALALGRRVHKELNNAMSASLLSETLLEVGRNQEALALLQELEVQKLNMQNAIYRSIALSRLGRPDEAGRIIEDRPLPEAPGAGLLFDYARIHALLGNGEKALGLLKGCLEKTPPSQLDMVKGFAKRSTDFKTLKDTPPWEAVMKTASKVSESSCSSGSSCATCPSRSGCNQESTAGDGEKK
jgi:tetratricopeptide (TPR) repeat protein